MTDTSENELIFLPLGGSEEVGMNANLYGFGPPDDRKWIIVDLGVTFGDPTTPGVDIIMPDLAYIEEYKDDLLGVVLTHAHEDHIGAVARLWTRLEAPIFATPFTAALLREKLRDEDLLDVASLTEVPLGGRVRLGPFDIELVTLTHSIPEPNGLAIRTPLGVVFHTGDWKIDPEPLVGRGADTDAIRRLGDAGLLAMVCDSTNVFVDGRAGSESEVRGALHALISGLTGKVAVACFASNVARMDTAMRAAEAAGRRVCLVGRSMHRMAAAARGVGLFEGLRPFIAEADAHRTPPDEILFLCTGSQGEPRAALARIADGTHPHVSLGLGDHVIFSSRVIPGNDAAIREVQNKLSDRGVRLCTEREYPKIHVSGHPCREELKDMYAWARPKIAIPTHGERRHLVEHAALARDVGVPEQLAPRNGDMVRLAPGPAVIIDEVKAGRLYLDGGVLTPENSEPLRERRHAAANGLLFAAIVLDRKGRLASEIEVRGVGLPGDEDYPLEEALGDLARTAETALKRLEAGERDDDGAVEHAVSRALKKASQRIWDRRPVVETVVLRV